MWDLSAYFGMFVSALGAATLLPLQSEAVLIALLLAKEQSVVVLLVVATLGNVLGSVINWLMGRYIEHFRTKSWFPISDEKLERAQLAYQKYGRWSLLLSWMPIIGDPLTIIAGIMREPLGRFLLLVSFAKAARYLVLAAVTLGLMDDLNWAE